MSRIASTSSPSLAAAASRASRARLAASSTRPAAPTPLLHQRTAMRSLRSSHTAASSASSRPVLHVSDTFTQQSATSNRTFASAASDTVDSDIVIVGAGVVGLGLACDLVASGAVGKPAAHAAAPITIVEASDLARLRSWTADRAAYLASHPSTSSSDTLDWENRVISLTADNLAWLRRIGVYPYLVEHRLRPVSAMRVWDGLSGALLDFDSADLEPGAASQISAMVEISNLQQAMLRFLEQGPGKDAVSVQDGVKVDGILPGSKVEAGSAVGEKDPWPVVGLSSGQGVRARLLVGADGPNSPVRRYAGIGDYGWAYNRKGLVGTLRCHAAEAGEPPVGYTAYQRFLPSGTIAFLPLSDSTASMVWTLEPQVAAALTMLHRDTAGSSHEPLARLVDAAFRLPWAHIERLFERVVAYTNHALPEGVRRDWSWLSAEIPDEAQWVERALGEPLPESSTGDVPPKIASLDAKSVASFPLNLKHADAYLGASLNGASPLPSGVLAGAMAAVGLAPQGAGQGAGRGRTVLVGDAAHTIHPLAGQGLNLGIADVRSLSATLRRAMQAGQDVGSYNALKPYARERYWENQKMLSAVDHLHWLYAGVPVPLAQQADGGRRQRSVDGLVKSAAKEVVGRGVVWARSTGLEVINELGFVKNAFMRQAGSTWRQTRSLHSSHRPRAGARQVVQIRMHSSGTGPLASDAYTGVQNGDAATTSTPSLASLTPSQRRALQDMLRVDHSGEIAANTIYQGQADMFGALGDKTNRDMAVEMWQTEKKHLDVMRTLLRQHNVRPSLLLPLWSVAGRVLGGATALLGPRSAMACTEAVESVIGEHYDDQLKELATILEQEEKAHPSLPLLSDIIREFRDDELEHLDTAVEHESQQAAGHALLSAVIAAGCRGAIWVASRV